MRAVTARRLGGEGLAELDRYETWLARRGRGRSAGKYCQVAARWLIDPEKVEGRIYSPESAPSYRRNLVAALRSFFRFRGDAAGEARLSDIRLPAPVPVDQREPLDPDEWRAVLAEIRRAPYLSEAQRGTCLLIAARGIRCGDVLRLKKREIAAAPKTGTLSFESKGGRWQHFSAGGIVAAALEILNGLSWGHDPDERVGDLVCQNRRRGSGLESAGASIRRCFDEVARALDMDEPDLYAHRFRHTYATRYLQQMEGDPEAIFKLQTQMGWARLDTAASYLRRSRREELDVIERDMLATHGLEDC